jgi:ribosomal protein S12 methylthiotransferase accessory factor
VIVDGTNSIGHLLELVSPRVGVIRSLSPVVRGAEEPDLPIIYQATLSHFDFRKAKTWERAAVGKGLNEHEAIRGAIGEAIEHYCASHLDTYKTRLAPWSSMQAEAVAPTECVLYSETQYAKSAFPYRRWNPTDEVTWLPMIELPGRRRVFVPAALVYLSMGQIRVEDFFCPATSNGLAAGPDLDFAVLHGLYELIERDSFLITWMNRLPAWEIDFSGRPGIACSIREHYARFGVEIHVFNISVDLPAYVMMGLAVDRTGRGPAAVVGLGCHLDPALAITKALFEVCQVRPGELRRYQQERPAAHLNSYGDVHTLEDHSAFFHRLEALKEFSFLLESGRARSLEELPNRSRGSVTTDLETCVAALTGCGSRVLYADLTTPDVTAYGLRVVRTVATGLQPMHFGFGEERLGGLRLYEIPMRLGHCSSIRGQDDLNPCPHPIA